jgi:hypothetical protein
VTEYEGIKQIVERLEKHLDEKIDRLEKIVMRAEDKTNCNREDVTRMQEQLKAGAEAFGRNDKQHTEFYSEIKILKGENDKISGGLKVIQIGIVPIIIAVIVALIKVFI